MSVAPPRRRLCNVYSRWVTPSSFITEFHTLLRYESGSGVASVNEKSGWLSLIVGECLIMACQARRGHVTAPGSAGMATEAACRPWRVLDHLTAMRSASVLGNTSVRKRCLVLSKANLLRGHRFDCRRKLKYMSSIANTTDGPCGSLIATCIM